MASIQDPDSELLLPLSDASAPAGGGGLTTCGLERNYANVLTLAGGFLLVFTAFQTTQVFPWPFDLNLRRSL